MGKPKVVQRESGNFLKRPILGTALTYDKGFSRSGAIDHNTYHEGGAAFDKAKAFGMTKSIRGNPLGCGCNVAYLHGIGEVKDGQIEADYVCDSGWHNYVVFEVNEIKEKEKQEVKIDVNGNITNEEGFKAGDLEEF
jgi:hypothetical protein